jgi:hypothetical protein
VLGAIVVILLGIVALVVILILATWLVRVGNAGSRPVAIAEGATRADESDTVRNTPANRLAIHQVDHPVLQPFAHNFSDLGFDTGERDGESHAFTVPAGKRLVVEDVSVGAHLGKGQRVEVHLIRIRGDGAHCRHAIALFHQISHPALGGQDSDTDFLAGGRPIRIYLEPGEKLTARARRDAVAHGAFIDMFVYGHFVDL